jgi:hypothetical protein
MGDHKHRGVSENPVLEFGSIDPSSNQLAESAQTDCWEYPSADTSVDQESHPGSLL